MMGAHPGRPWLSIVWHCLIFSALSVVMIVVNKGAIRSFPFPSTLLLLQNTASVALLLCFERANRRGVQFDLQLAMAWAPCAALFCSNLFTSLSALHHVSVATFTVFRNVQPFLTAMAQWMVAPEEAMPLHCLGGLAIALLGAMIYAYNDLTVSFIGYAWSMLHIVSMTAYLLLVKHRGTQMTAAQMSLFNNVESVFPFFFLGLAVREIPASLSPERLFVTSTLETPIYVILSCFAAVGISVSAFNVQQCVSPTAFITLNNMAKVPALLLSYYLFDTVMTPLMALGLATTLLGGYLFALFPNGTALKMKRGSNDPCGRVQ